MDGWMGRVNVIEWAESRGQRARGRQGERDVNTNGAVETSEYGSRSLARCSSSYIEVPVEGAAAGPAIEPEHDGIRGRGLALALHEPVVKVLTRRPPTAGGREVEIAAILPR